MATGAPWRVAVVGAGLAGLTVAHAVRRRLQESGRPLALEVWEAGDRPGGMLHTSVEDGYVVEWAANAFRTGVGPTADLVARLGLGGEQVHADPAANRRYVFHGGRLHLMPSGPISLLSFAPLSPAGRWRVVAEPFLAGRVDGEESVHDYASRHIGSEAAEVLLGTMVRGVYGGDARALSVDAAFPVMREMERDHRSLIVAGIAGARERARERKTTWSFRGGMQALIDRLAEDLGGSLRLGAPVRRLEVDPETGEHVLHGNDGARRFDAVVLAVPPRVAAELLRDVDDVAAEEIAGIPRAPIGMVALAYPRTAFRTPPDGFGFLVAPGEDLKVLGTLVESNVFPHRAPPDVVLVRVIMGGADHMDLNEKSDEERAAIAMDAVDRAWGVDGAPIRSWVGRQTDGIPQYVLGHQARVARVEERLRRRPGLHLAGNAYRGIAVGKLVDDAELVADTLMPAVAAR